MGQQQLLFIVLGLIIVSIAIIAGINFFNTSQNESVKDELISHSLAIGSNAQQFFVKPTHMGGGDNTFNSGGAGNAGFVIPGSMQSTENGTYTGVATTFTYTITATPKTIANKTYSFSSVTCVVSPTTMVTTVN
ncbi:MAG: hypothetical protein P4L35_19705 [Ignavibacteriaceae bacterium]|nr:hypothetical protein [Ignavibacteriaceae bacterium]